MRCSEKISKGHVSFCHCAFFCQRCSWKLVGLQHPWDVTSQAQDRHYFAKSTYQIHTTPLEVQGTKRETWYTKELPIALGLPRERETWCTIELNNNIGFIVDLHPGISSSCSNSCQEHVQKLPNPIEDPLLWHFSTDFRKYHFSLMTLQVLPISLRKLINLHSLGSCLSL